MFMAIEAQHPEEFGSAASADSFPSDDSYHDSDGVGRTSASYSSAAVSQGSVGDSYGSSDGWEETWEADEWEPEETLDDAPEEESDDYHDNEGYDEANFFLKPLEKDEDDFFFNGEELGADQFQDAAYYTGANSRQKDSLRLKQQTFRAKQSEKDNSHELLAARAVSAALGFAGMAALIALAAAFRGHGALPTTFGAQGAAAAL